jgi:hypothetical protein
MDGGRENQGEEHVATSDEERVAAVPPRPATLTRVQAAQAMAVSERTIRRRTASGELTATVDERGVRRYSATQIETLRRSRTTTVADPDEGATAARVFRQLEGGATPVSIVERLELAPARVEQLCADWARLRGGLFLSVDDLTELIARFRLDAPVRDGRHLLDELSRAWPTTTCATCGAGVPTTCGACLLRTTEAIARRRAAAERAERAERDARRERAETRAILRGRKP